MGVWVSGFQPFAGSFVATWGFAPGWGISGFQP